MQRKPSHFGSNSQPSPSGSRAVELGQHRLERWMTQGQVHDRTPSLAGTGDPFRTSERHEVTMDDRSGATLTAAAATTTVIGAVRSGRSRKPARPPTTRSRASHQEAVTTSPDRSVTSAGTAPWRSHRTRPTCRWVFRSSGQDCRRGPLAGIETDSNALVDTSEGARSRRGGHRHERPASTRRSGDDNEITGYQGLGERRCDGPRPCPGR